MKYTQGKSLHNILFIECLDVSLVMMIVTPVCNVLHFFQL